MVPSWYYHAIHAISKHTQMIKWIRKQEEGKKRLLRHLFLVSLCVYIHWHKHLCILRNAHLFLAKKDPHPYPKVYCKNKQIVCLDEKQISFLIWTKQNKRASGFQSIDSVCLTRTNLFWGIFVAKIKSTLKLVFHGKYLPFEWRTWSVIHKM